MNNKYSGDQHDDIEKLLDDAEKLISTGKPEMMRQGSELRALAEARMKRESHRLLYARMTNQLPNIPALEAAPRLKQLKQ